MRRRLSIALGALALVYLVAAPVAFAAPGQSSWDGGTGRAFDQCTGEFYDNTFNVHFVETDTGPFHFNVHIVGVGETSGASFVGNNQDSEILHASPDGTFAFDRVINVHLVSQGNLPNSMLTIRIHVILDADGNVISGRSDASFTCQGS
jgi:hypothetical protein